MLPSKCSKNNEHCPQPRHKQNGEKCFSNFLGICWEGYCKFDLKDVCQKTSGTTDYLETMKRNVEGTNEHNCGYNFTSNQFIPCELKNILCGSFACGISLDRAGEFFQPKMMTRWLTPTGVVCGPASICHRGECLSVDAFSTQPCRENCNENGYCALNGLCYCNKTNEYEYENEETCRIKEASTISAQRLTNLWPWILMAACFFGLFLLLILSIRLSKPRPMPATIKPTLRTETSKNKPKCPSAAKLSLLKLERQSVSATNRIVNSVPDELKTVVQTNETKATAGAKMNLNQLPKDKKKFATKSTSKKVVPFVPKKSSKQILKNNLQNNENLTISSTLSIASVGQSRTSSIENKTFFVDTKYTANDKTSAGLEDIYEKKKHAFDKK